MANSSVPKHDFVPAWLKISGENQSSLNSDNRERLSRRDNRSTVKGPSLGRQRQSSCDQQYSHREGQDLSHSNISYRHHSIDIDQSQYYNCGLGDCHISGYRHFGSHPSLNRRTLSRQEQPYFNYTSAYKGYSLYDFSSENYSNNSNFGWSQGRHRSFERSSSGSNSNTQNNKKEAAKDSKKDTTTDRFNQEFPSLKGDTNDSTNSPSVSVNGGVWDNLRNTRVHLNSGSKKIQLTEKTMKNDSEKRSGSPGTLTSSTVSPIGKITTTKSTSASIVQITKSNLQSQSNSLSPIYQPLTTLTRKPSKDSFKSSSPLINKNSRQSSPTPPLDILNTRLITHPKNVGNKNDFLKTLRNETEKPAEVQENKKETVPDENGTNLSDCTDEEKNKENEDKMEETLKDFFEAPDETVSNSNRSLDESTEKPILSSSLEAEQRLLKEMGWKEEGSDDEGVYAPLTEDEMQEFANLSKKISQQRNGVPRTLHLTWSPKRLAPFNSASLIPLDDDSCSTSFSDSD